MDILRYILPYHRTLPPVVVWLLCLPGDGDECVLYTALDGDADLYL